MGGSRSVMIRFGSVKSTPGPQAVVEKSLLSFTHTIDGTPGAGVVVKVRGDVSIATSKAFNGYKKTGR